MKIKGHTQIILTDVKTGKVEKIESDNLVTNAVKEFLSFWQPLLGWKAIATYFMPLWQKMFGGIYLFDIALTESASNTFLPNVADAKLTGYAGNTTSGGEDTKRGSLNINESEEITNGYKFVWDFGTSEANGTIACACLTNPLAGYHGYNYDPLGALYSGVNNTGNTGNNYKGMGWTSGTSNQGVLSRNDAFFVLYNMRWQLGFKAQNDKITHEGLYCNNALNFFKGEIETNNMNLLKNYGNVAESNEQVAATGLYSGDGLGFDTGEKYIYFITTNTDIYVNIINKSNRQYESRFTIPYYTQTGKFVRGTHINSSYRSDGAGAVYKNGYIYFIVYDSGDNRNQGYVAKLNISTHEVSIITPKFTQTVRGGGYAQSNMFVDVNGNILAGGYLIYGNDEYLPIESSFTIGSYAATYQISNYACLLNNYETYARIMPNLQYLATINNLSSPVEKTASKTMKVTYTLTLAE